LLAAVLAAPVVARAQGKYPERPIKIIVPYPPGGGVDLTARLLMEPLSKELGQPIMVENKGGAGGIIGVEAMSHAPPDGYTVSLTGVSTLSAGPHMRKMPFDPMALAHITRLVRMPLIVAVPAALALFLVWLGGAFGARVNPGEVSVDRLSTAGRDLALVKLRPVEITITAVGSVQPRRKADIATAMIMALVMPKNCATI
jgi:tripartite-type tricarboxylate transporter receptor subunit TctC